MILPRDDLVKLLGNIWTSDEGREALTYLTDSLESRFAGSEGENLAADFLIDKFNEYGLQGAEKQEFDIQGWQRESTDFFLKSKPETKFPAIALPFCPPKTVKGNLLDLGDGLEEDFERDIKDKVVTVTNRRPSHRKGSLTRKEKYKKSVEGGAAGFIFINHRPGNLPPTGSLKSNEIGEIPGIGIAKETGEKIGRASCRERV